MAKEFTVAAITVFALLLVRCWRRRTLFWAAIVHTITIILAVALAFLVHTHRRRSHTHVVDRGCHGHRVRTAPRVDVVPSPRGRVTLSDRGMLVTGMRIVDIGIETVCKLPYYLHALLCIFPNISCSVLNEVLSDLAGQVRAGVVVMAMGLEVRVVLIQQWGIMGMLMPAVLGVKLLPAPRTDAPFLLRDIPAHRNRPGTGWRHALAHGICSADFGCRMVMVVYNWLRSFGCCYRYLTIDRRLESTCRSRGRRRNWFTKRLTRHRKWLSEETCGGKVCGQRWWR